MQVFLWLSVSREIGSPGCWQELQSSRLDLCCLSTSAQSGSLALKVSKAEKRSAHTDLSRGATPCPDNELFEQLHERKEGRATEAL